MGVNSNRHRAGMAVAAIALAFALLAVVEVVEIRSQSSRKAVDEAPTSLQHARIVEIRSLINTSSSSLAPCPHNGCPVTPSSSLVVDSSQLPGSVLELLQQFHQTSAVSVAELMTAQQNPADCASARYLLVDDISTVSGLGYSMLNMIPLALQALVDGRVLVHASSVIQGARWSWCQEPPYSVDCYYRPWSSCISHLRSLNLSMQDLWDAPAWNTPEGSDSTSSSTRTSGGSTSSSTSSSSSSAAKIKAWTEHANATSRDGAHNWIRPMFAAHSKASQLWWFGLFMRQYFSPSPAMDAEAAAFLQSSGLKPSDSFIVVNVRHGSKGTEQKVIEPEEFVEPIKQTLACLNTTHVFLVTETRRVAERMLELGKQHGFHVFTINYTYSDVDVWNHQLVPELAAAAGAGAASATAASMREISYVSAKALAVTQRGSAFIGTLQSAWAKVSVAAMYGWHQRPVPTWTLRKSWALERGYVGQDQQFFGDRTKPSTQLPWPCVAAPPPLEPPTPAPGTQPKGAQQQTQKHQQGQAVAQLPAAPTTCTAEGYVNGSRQELWRFVNDRSPALMDVIHAQDRVYAVFNLKLPQPWLSIPWASRGRWNMTFWVGGPSAATTGRRAVTVPAQPLTQSDGGQYTLVVFAYTPPGVVVASQQQQQPAAAHFVDIAVAVEMRAPSSKTGGKATDTLQLHERVYRQAPFCIAPSAAASRPGSAASSSGNLQAAQPAAAAWAGASSPPGPPAGAFRHLVGCTEILAARVLHLVPEWVAWHHLQGVQHMFIYVDDDPALATKQLQPLIAAGLVTVVDFRWPEKSRKAFTDPKCPQCKTSWSQQSQMHSCLLRARGNARWLALHDVDEFFQVMEAAPTTTSPAAAARQHPTTVADFLTSRSHAEHVAAWEVSSQYFGLHRNATRQAALNASSNGLVIGQFAARAHRPVVGTRTKLIVSPTSVVSLAVHVVAEGGQVQRLNASTDMRLAHFKPDRVQPMEDTSLAQHAERVKQLLDSFKL